MIILLKLCLHHNTVFAVIVIFFNLVVYPLYHNLEWCIMELHRKYEAIYPEFNGAAMPLKHFIVHYLKGRGH